MSKEFFDSVADGWDSRCNHDEKKIEHIVRFLDIEKGDKIIDVACGTGVLFKYLLKYKPGKILAIDYSPRMIENAKKKANNGIIELINDDFFNLMLSDYDKLIAYSAYPHFEDKKKLAKHISSLLKKGGRFMICHSQRRQEINNLHKKAGVKSAEIQDAKTEAGHFKEYFKIDILTDDSEMFILSGIKL